MIKLFIKSIGFGLTSGIITTLGLIISFYFATNSKIIIIGGILTIALADSFSDAMGMHISAESENKYKQKEIWLITFMTLISKAIFTLSFILPFMLLQMQDALIVSLVWAFSLLILSSIYLAKIQNKNKLHIIMEHLIISVIVVIATYFIGNWIHNTFI